jgi:PPOX class probable F420-dependent enzyme
MPRPPLPDNITKFLAGPNPAVITTIRPDGQPVSVATWYLLDEEGRILVSMDEKRRRLEYMRNDPRVSMTVLDAQDWSRHVSIQGRVVQLRNDPNLNDIDQLCQRYTGDKFSTRDRSRVSALIAIDRWHAWEIDDHAAKS